MLDRGAVTRGPRPLERPGPLQPDLFSGTQIVERVLARSGTVVRLRLRPLGGGRVRVEEAARRLPGRLRFEAWPEEEGREVAFALLGLTVAYDVVFGPAAEVFGPT
jgi:hypothetical protein